MIETIIPPSVTRVQTFATLAQRFATKMRNLTQLISNQLDVRGLCLEALAVGRGHDSADGRKLESEMQNFAAPIQSFATADRGFATGMRNLS